MIALCRWQAPLSKISLVRFNGQHVFNYTQKYKDDVRGLIVISEIFLVSFTIKSNTPQMKLLDVKNVSPLS